MRAWLWEHFKAITGVWFITLFSKLPALAGRLLSWFGVSLFGLSYAMPLVKDKLASFFSQLPPTVTNYIVYLNVDKALVVVLSAVAVVVTNRVFWGKKT